MRLTQPEQKQSEFTQERGRRKNVPSSMCYLDRLHASAPKDVVKMETSLKYGEEVKYVTVRFDPKLYPDQIEILHITDVQFGHLACNVEKFIEYRNWILSHPNRFVFFGGDLIDAATCLSIASPYENTEEPQGQVYRFVELAMPMRHRVLGYVGGNHERRGVKSFGDLGKLIAMLLKVPYSSGKQFIDVHYGKHKPFRAALWHGGTGSKTKGAKAQMLHRWMQQGNSDLYLVGHLHDVLMVGDVRTRTENGKVVLEKYAGVMSSSFLEHFGTYAEVAGMPAGDCQMWRTILYPNGKWEMTLR
jgi:Calcineurin-like phosphoesterase